jgi:UDP-GlcNAc:undecaprenyl-phosphate/decaprenyl-phosphate GlcNAc-1-phosphate transferase
MLNYLHTHLLIYYFVVLCCSAGITLFAIPSILYVARKRHLYDDLGHFRKEHDHGIPRLGGVAMFVSFTITVLMFSIATKELPVNCLITACIILLAVGLKDDLHGVNPSNKFLMQLIIALVLVICGDIRITNLYGIMGINELPYVLSVLITIFGMILVINAFNLIDGVDGLAGTLGIMANGVFAGLFVYLHQYQLAAVALAIIGSILGFLKYNITPAKLFMGDTGSLLTGLISVIMGIELVKYGTITSDKIETHWLSAPALVIAAFITPLFDTTRVFVLRIAAGTSPFKADRNHLHHRMLKLGLTHIQTTLLLLIVNVVIILLVIAAGAEHTFASIIGVVISYMIFNWALTFCLRSKERENIALRNLFV